MRIAERPMIERGTWIHLRFPFSFFLLPIYLFAVSEAPRPLDIRALCLTFVALHALLYPASNGFNSCCDRDEGSIGGIEHPPPVTENLLFWSLLLDVLAVTVAAFVSPWLALTACVYGLFSKAYSWDRIRLKSRPLAAWLGIGLVQGGLVFVAVTACVGAAPPSLHAPRLWSGAAAIALFYLAGYPLTQIYQHEEDRRRGDRTISMACGIRGTFVLSAALFLVAAGAFSFHYGVIHSSPRLAAAFLACQIPLAGHFAVWARKAWQDPSAADFRHAMALSRLSATIMNCFFVGILLTS